MWGRVLGLIDGLTSRRGLPDAIGISIGGPLDLQRELVCSPPNLPYWDDIPLPRLLSERYGVPASMEHDARAGVLAEWRFGAARGRSHVVFLTAGTGLGAGVIVGDRLLRGATGRAGEVGHWRMTPDGPEAYGKTGSWEALSSGGGLPRLAAHLGAREAGDLADAATTWRVRGQVTRSPGMWSTSRRPGWGAESPTSSTFSTRRWSCWAASPCAGATCFSPSFGGWWTRNVYPRTPQPAKSWPPAWGSGWATSPPSASRSKAVGRRGER